MGWGLGPGIGFCQTGGELVFIDLARDRYLALRDGDRAAFERLRRGEASDSDAMTRLARTGLIVRTERPAMIEPARIDVPVRDLSAVREDGFSLPGAIRAARALRWARRAMRPDRIADTVADFRRPGDARNLSDAQIEQIAARYAALRWFDPIPSRCLIDALALGRIMRQRGGHATLVFGVRLAPFAAHCWLQTGSVILTGTAADARNYTPILVAG